MAVTYLHAQLDWMPSTSTTFTQRTAPLTSSARAMWIKSDASTGGKTIWASHLAVSMEMFISTIWSFRKNLNNVLLTGTSTKRESHLLQLLISLGSLLKCSLSVPTKRYGTARIKMFTIQMCHFPKYLYSTTKRHSSVVLVRLVSRVLCICLLYLK
jgi:hypothetical protein